MKKINIPNPEDYPESRSVPWDKGYRHERNCFTYAMNSGLYPGPSIGQMGTYYLKGDLSKMFGDHLPKSWHDIVQKPQVPEGLTESSKEFFKREVDDAVRDGLIPVQEPVSCKGFRLVAMVACFEEEGSEINDYHWLRLDRDGRWSHKDGFEGDVALLKDSDQKQVICPQIHFNTIGPDKSIFASYFLVPKDDSDLGTLPYDQEPERLDMI